MHTVPAMHTSKLKQAQLKRARRWARYVKRATLGHSQAEIARRTGVSQGTISRWFNGDSHTLPSATTAVHVARAYNVDPVRALVELGIITSEEAGRVERPDVLAFSTQQLIDELSRRSKADVA